VSFVRFRAPLQPGITDFNPIAMVRKEAQQAYFKDKNIETVLGDLG
jgi:hypothetical protein